MKFLEANRGGNAPLKFQAANIRLLFESARWCMAKKKILFVWIVFQKKM